jgi:hypothetical protein
MKHKPPFWRRRFDCKAICRNQFNCKPTIAQNLFDVAFGILLPLVCLYFDPIVFRTEFGRPLVGNFGLVGHTAIAIGILTLAAWLVTRRLPALFCGALAGGAIFSFLLGLVILPSSLIGIIFWGMGLLGLTPFATAFVFARNSIRAHRHSGGCRAVPSQRVVAAAGLAIACVGPWAAHFYVKREIGRAARMIVSNEPAQFSRGKAILQRYQAVNNLDRIVHIYDEESDPMRRALLAQAYEQATATSIEYRHWQIVID